MQRYNSEDRTLATRTHSLDTGQITGSFSIEDVHSSQLWDRGYAPRASKARQFPEMLSFEKLVDLGSAAPRVCVMCQNISDWPTVDCLIVYRVLPIASHICFHQKSTTLA